VAIVSNTTVISLLVQHVISYIALRFYNCEFHDNAFSPFILVAVQVPGVLVDVTFTECSYLRNQLTVDLVLQAATLATADQSDLSSWTFNNCTFEDNKNTILSLKGGRVYFQNSTLKNSEDSSVGVGGALLPGTVIS
jgi:hypothetical protein